MFLRAHPWGAHFDIKCKNDMMKQAGGETSTLRSFWHLPGVTSQDASNSSYHSLLPV